MGKSDDYWDRWEHYQRHGEWPKSNKNVSKAQSKKIPGNLSMSDETPNRVIKKSKPSNIPEDSYYGKQKPSSDTPPDGMLF
jgi:hypothetical protein